jgi:ATP-dependent exoDNAse (exonuclease V) alpha subunit
MELTQGQLAAIDKIKDFTEGKLQGNRFCLYGAAGTGKTTILKEVLNNMSERKRIGLSAPTHKAVGIFSKMMYRKGVTLHSLLGLMPNLNLEDYSNTNPVFMPKRDPEIQKYDLIIHDETSMLGYNLDKKLIDLAYKHGVKILYIGDKYQLPPIKCSQTDAFSIENKIELLEIVRQEKGNPLLELFAIIRDDVKFKTLNFIQYLKKNPKMISEINGVKVGYQMIKNYEDMLDSSKEILVNADNVRYLAFTNDNIAKINKYIRNNLFHSEDLITKGDIITGYTTLSDEDNFFAPILTNSSDYKVVDVEKYTSNFGIEGFKIELEDLTTGKISSIFTPNHRNVKNFTDKFYLRFKELRDRALTADIKNKGRFWKEFYEFKNFNMLMTDLPVINQYGKKEIVSYKDIDYGYGQSVHRSQGSTYNTVNIDLNNIMYGNIGKLQTNREFMLKLIYVAMSRARNFINIKI